MTRANVTRFNDMLDEMCDAQIPACDHHALCGGNGAYGSIVWRDDARTGVSQLVSVDLKRLKLWLREQDLLKHQRYKNRCRIW